MVAKRTQLCCTQQSLVKFSEMFSSFGRGFSFGNILRDYRIKSIQLLEEILEEILEVKTFLKMSIGVKCRGSKVELRFCSFLDAFILVLPIKKINKTVYVSRRLLV